MKQYIFCVALILSHGLAAESQKGAVHMERDRVNTVCSGSAHSHLGDACPMFCKDGTKTSGVCVEDGNYHFACEARCAVPLKTTQRLKKRLLALE